MKTSDMSQIILSHICHTCDQHFTGQPLRQHNNKYNKIIHKMIKEAIDTNNCMHLVLSCLVFCLGRHYRSPPPPHPHTFYGKCVGEGGVLSLHVFKEERESANFSFLCGGAALFLGLGLAFSFSSSSISSSWATCLTEICSFKSSCCSPLLYKMDNFLSGGQSNWCWFTCLLSHVIMWRKKFSYLTARSVFSSVLVSSGSAHQPLCK